MTAGKRVRAVRLGGVELKISRRADGSVVLRTPPVEAYPERLTDRLEYWAARAPQRVLFAQRDTGGGWRSLTYAQALEQARAIGAYLLEKGLSAERPLVVLSGNDIEHALLHLGAMYVGVPYAPVSPAYSLLSKDFSRLRYIVDLLTPGLMFANGPQYRPALDLFQVDRLEKFTDALRAPRTRAVEEAHARVGPETIAKFLFTSGSTGMPKAVINTQRMWCSNQAVIASQFAFFQDEPPVLVDWAPWHHTAAGNHDFGLVIYNGGSYYIDEGKPTPGAIETTVRNLREVAPNWYFNVPKGFEALLPYLREDERLRENFFSRLKVLWFAGAAMAQHVFDEFKRLAREACGEEILFLTGLGSTETAPYAMGRMWETEDVANMGLPAPGMEWKFVPLAGKLDARLKGPNITPGYWRQPELTAAAFDEEGYYRLGDAFVFQDPERPEKGLLFRGRLAEDFKLATGTWVHVGPLRAAFIQHFAPLVRDVVFAGEGRSELGALIFPAMETSLGEIRRRLVRFSEKSTGTSNRVARALLLEEPPSLDAGEMTDKGSINQRTVLERRRALVEELYRDPPSEAVLWI